MHYYKRNIGDYAKKAGRLTMLQHGSYTLLLDSCYDREQFPTLEQALEWTWASTKEEVEAVTFVLHKFFVLTDGVFVQKRIQEELTDFQDKSETNKRIALERETKRRENSTNRAKSNTNRDAVVNEPPPNHEPRTKNQEPTTEPDGFNVFWQAYPKKKAKPAALKAFVKAKINWDLHTVLEDIANQSQSQQWLKNSGEFIPMPSTYLNNRRWEDGNSEQQNNLGVFL